MAYSIVWLEKAVMVESFSRNPSKAKQERLPRKKAASSLMAEFLRQPSANVNYIAHAEYEPPYLSLAMLKVLANKEMISSQVIDDKREGSNPVMLKL